MATATSASEIESEIVESAEVGDDITHIGIHTGSSGTGGFLFSFALTNNPAALVLGETVKFDAGDLVITYTPPSNMHARAAVDVLEAILSGQRYLSYHTSNPGNTGSSSISGIAYTSVVASDWTFAQ